MTLTPQSVGYADLHMHTTASDGVAPVRELLNYIARKRSHLNVIAITDHDTLDAALWACDHQDHYPFEIVPGIEVTSRIGHILALWVTTPIPARMDLNDTVAAIHEAGGLAVLAHPFHIEMDFVRQNALRYGREPQVLLESGLDAVEVHNAGLVTPGSNLVARLMAKRIGIAVTGSSDAHTPGAVGSGVTRFMGSTAAELRYALDHKLTTAEGTAWLVTEYIKYLQHAGQRMAKQSLAQHPS